MLEENWNAVQVFLRCAQGYLASMAGAWAMGFTAVEIESGCRLCAIAERDWPELSEQVRDMGRVAAEALNRRHAR